MTDPLVWTLLLVLVSPAVGSFLGVLVDRLPRGEDVIRRPSSCRSCAHPLGLRDLMPVVSFVVARGRCRFCGAGLPHWLLYLEIAAMGAAVLAVIAGSSAGEAWAMALFLWCLIALTAADLLWFRLPDLLTVTLFGAALLLSVCPTGVGAVAALWGAALGGGSFLAIRVIYRALRGREGLGLGDVKLMFGLGAFAGPWDVPLLVLMAALGALIAAGIASRGGRLSGQMRLPFGAALCAAGGALWAFRLSGVPLP